MIPTQSPFSPGLHSIHKPFLSLIGFISSSILIMTIGNTRTILLKNGIKPQQPMRPVKFTKKIFQDQYFGILLIFTVFKRSLTT